MPEILLVIALVACVIIVFVTMRERNRVYADAKKIRQSNEAHITEIDSLKETVKKLKARVHKSGGSTVTEDPPKSGKSKSKDSKKDPVDTGGAEAPSQSSSSSKVVKDLKKERYDLKNRVKELTQQLKDSSGADKDAQRAVLSLREELTQATEQAEIDKERIKNLTAELDSIEAGERSASPTPEPAKEGATEEADAVETKLKATISRLRDDIKRMKDEHAAALRSARKEVDSEVRHARDKDSTKFKRQVSRFKKRTENLHRVFLITRGQLLLLEDKLKAVDPTFVSPRHFSTNFRGIDEALKMFDTRDAREAKQMEDAQSALVASRKRIHQLEQEIATSSAAYSADQADDKKSASSKKDAAESAARNERPANGAEGNKSVTDEGLGELLAVVGGPAEQDPAAPDEGDVGIDDLDDLWDDDDLDDLDA